MSSQSASPADLVQDEELTIEDAATLKVLADPLRIHLLGELSLTPRTVKELASIVGVPQTRLYYHMKLLERHGVIRVVGRRMVSGIEERTYQTVAKSTVVSPALGTELARSGAVKALFDLFATQMEVALGASVSIGEPDSAVIALSTLPIFLAPDEVPAFLEALRQFLNSYSDEGRRDRPEYDFLIAGYRKADRDAS
jgi:DNA-binding transcriptional ArsR family regulator